MIIKYSKTNFNLIRERERERERERDNKNGCGLLLHLKFYIAHLIGALS